MQPFLVTYTCTRVNNVVLLSVIDMIVQPFDTAQLGTILSIMHSMPATHYLGTALSTVAKYPDSPAYHVHGWCLVIMVYFFRSYYNMQVEGTFMV